MSEINAVKIPPYNFHDPSLWFIMCESTFALGLPKPITESSTKFNYIVAHLPPEAAQIVRDAIINPDKTDPYDFLKKELIKRTGESSQQEIRKLLVGEELGDRKPSELLRVMKRRAEAHKVSDELMLELFLQHLPTSVQSILASITPLTIDKAAEVADRIIEVTPLNSILPSANAISNTVENKLLNEIEKLNKRIDKLCYSDQRSRNRSRDSTENRRRSVSRTRNPEFCWYHVTFGEKAFKCKPPCSFSKNEKSEE